MDAIIDLIRKNLSASDNFMAKMIKLGWTDELRRTGQLLHFNIRCSHIYEINDLFHKISRDIKIPDGVVAIKYTIDLTNLPFIGADDAINYVKELNSNKISRKYHILISLQLIRLRERRKKATKAE